MKYKFCKQLQNSIFIGFDSLVHCCNCTQDQSPVFQKNYKGQKVDWKAIVDEKLKFQENAKYSIESYFPFSACENCHMYVDGEWDDGGYINEITISHWTKCNCNCFYCFTAIDKNHSQTRETYLLMPILEDMKKSNVLNFSKENGIVRFLGGDVAMLDNFDEIQNFFLEQGATNFYIPTSAIKYLSSVQNLLEKGFAEVIVSVDSGSKEIYKKIKRVDVYDTVISNIQKYAEAAKKGKSIFKAKYILLPFVNDTKEEIDKFLENCIKIGVENIACDCEDNFITIYKESIPANIPELIEYMHQRGQELGLKVQQGIAKVDIYKEKEQEEKLFMEKLLTR